MRSLAVSLVVVALWFCCVSGAGASGIEPYAGYCDPEGEMGGTFILGANFSIGPVAAAAPIFIEPGAAFWRKGYSVYGYSWSWTYIGAVCNARYDVAPEGSNVTFFPFAGLSLSLQRWSGKVSYFDPFSGQTTTADESDSEVDFGLRFGGGVAFPAGTMTFVARAGFETNGGADYLFLTGGLRF